MTKLNIASYQSAKSVNFNEWLGATRASSIGRINANASAARRMSSDYNNWFNKMSASADIIPTAPVELKPMSFNYMALTAPTYRAQEYATAADPATNPDQLNVGDKYHKPTEKVGQGIVNNLRIWEDIKTLGGKLVHHGANILKGIIDVVSTPAYMIRNTQKALLENKYKAPESAGGEDVTPMEHISAFARAWSPLGWAMNSIEERIDNIQGNTYRDAAFKGLTWKEKTSNLDLLKVSEPEWVKNNPKLATGLGIAGDIIIDPLTFVTMGANPGSIARGTKGLFQLGTGRKAVAMETFRNTYFTKAGRQKSVEAVSAQIRNADIKKASRRQGKAEYHAGIKATGGTNKYQKFKKGMLTKSEAAYRAKAAEYAAEITRISTQQLKGLDLAQRVMRRSLNPLHAMSMASEFSTGAKYGGGLLAGGKTIADAHAAAIKSSVDVMKNDPAWSIHYNAWKANPQDFSYRIKGGDIKTVKFTEAKTMEEWLTKVVQEAAPVAKYAEFNARQARGRKGRIVSTEGRGFEFANAFMTRQEGLIRRALNPQQYAIFRQQEALDNDLFLADAASHKLIDDPALLNIREDDIHKYSYNQLKKDARELWKNRNPGRPFNNDSSIVIVNTQGQAKKVKLSVLKKHIVNRNSYASQVKAAEDIIGRRTAAEAAQAALSGLSAEADLSRLVFINAFEDLQNERAAVASLNAAHQAAQQKVIDAFDAGTTALANQRSVRGAANRASRTLNNAKVQEGRVQRSSAEADFHAERAALDADVTTAEAEVATIKDEMMAYLNTGAALERGLSPEATAMVNKIFDILDKKTGLSDDEMEIARTALMDDSVNIEQRVANAIGNPELDTNDAEDLIEAIFEVKIIGNRVFATSGGKLEVALPEIIQTVMHDRWENRVKNLVGQGGSNLDFVDGQFNLNRPNAYIPLNRDDFGEIALMVMDGVRAGLEYAVREEMLDDPMVLFNTIENTVNESLNFVTADLKNQVLNHMFNMFGLHFPEQFVPSVDKVVNSLPNGSNPFKFTNRHGVELPDISQQLTWQDLKSKITSQFFKVFPHLNSDDFRNSNLFNNIDPEKISKYLDDTRIPDTSRMSDETIAKGRELWNAIVELERIVRGHRGSGINRYSMTDMFLFTEEILKAHTTTFRAKKRITGNEVDEFGSVSIGRLSALDSFNFLSPSAQHGLMAIRKLKHTLRYDNAGEDAKALSEYIVKQFMRKYMYEENYLGTLETGNLGGLFQTMGMQAFLKEGSFPTGVFGPKHAADLLEHLWGDVTVNHEWSKALHNKILSNTVVNNYTPEQAAKLVEDDIKKFFAAHDSIRKIIYPDPTTGVTRPVDARHIIQTQFGPESPVRNQVPAGSELKAGGQALLPGVGNPASPRPPVQVDPMREAFNSVIPVAENYINAAARHDDLPKARAQLDNALDAQQLHAMRQTPNEIAADRVAKAQADYDAKQAALIANSDSIRNRPTKSERDRAELLAKAAPQQVNPASIDRAGNAGDVYVVKEGALTDARAAITANPSDMEVSGASAFQRRLENEQNATTGTELQLGIKDSDYTDAEISVIRNWITHTYATDPPELVIEELKAMSSRMMDELLEAQLRMVTDLHNMNVRHGASVRFMGMPFLKAPNPMNVTHSLAGVTAMAQKRSRAWNAWNNMASFTKPEASNLSRIRRHITRQSHVFENALERIRATVVNGVAVTRKKTIEKLDQLYIQQVHGSEYVDTTLNSMTPKQRMSFINRQLFDTSKPLDNILNNFKDVNGLNPLKEVAAVFETHGVIAFADMHGESLLQTLRTFNRYLPKKYSLTDDQITFLGSYIDSGKALDPDAVIPFSLDWIRKVGKLLPESKLGFNNIKDFNLPEFHYALLDSSYRIEEGRRLQKNVWEEFAFLSTDRMAKAHDNARALSLDPNTGQPVRGNWVALDDLIKPNTPGNIASRYVPKNFLGYVQPGQRYYISSDYVPEIKVLFEYMEGINELNDTVNIGLVRKVLNYFKSAVTIYKIPAYPVRNLIADVFMGAMDGLVDPKWYRDAAVVQMRMSNSMKELDLKDAKGIFDDAFIQHELSLAQHDPNMASKLPGSSTSRMTLVTNEGTINLTDADIWNMYEDFGLGQNRVSGNIQESLASARMNKATRVGGKIHDVLRKTNDVREDSGRLAHFMYALSKEASNGGDLRHIALRAKDRVIKYHFDYGDVSIFERKTVGNWIPFYKWVKNIIPFTIAAVVTKPWALKLDIALSKMAGNLINDNPDDPRTDFIIPDYIENEMAVPIGWFADPEGNKFNQWMSLNLPLSETIARTISPSIEPFFDESIIEQGWGKVGKEMGSGVAATALSMMGPHIKAPMQAATGMTFWPTGPSPEQPGEGWPAAVAALIPGVPFIQELQRNARKNASNEAAGYTDLNKPSKVLNWWGIAGVANNTERAQLGQINRIADANNAQRDRLIAEKAILLQEKIPGLSTADAEAAIKEYLKSQRMELK